MIGDRSSAEAIRTDSFGIKFVFLDRDGVINGQAVDGGYVSSWGGIQVLPGVERAIARLNRAARKVIVVTNQRGIALGHLSERDLNSIHEELQAHLAKFRAHLDAIYYCPHDLGQCNCRKPATGLFERAFRDFPEASPDNSVMIGDSECDIVAGISIGMRTILISNDPNTCDGWTAKPSVRGGSLLEVVETYLS